MLALVFLYYIERNTTSTILTKVAMPVLAVAGGLLPHQIRRLRFVFSVCGLAAGIAGLFAPLLRFYHLYFPDDFFCQLGCGFYHRRFWNISFGNGSPNRSPTQPQSPE
jgi:hypothetical protein